MAAATGSGPRGALVLVADRDPVVRELEAHFLGEAGFAVEFVDDGPGALERALQIQPDIVVTEVLLPKLDGLALCRRLKAEPSLRDVPVVVFSVLAAAERAREAGAAAFLSKPLAERVLLETVRAVLAERARSAPGGAEAYRVDGPQGTGEPEWGVGRSMRPEASA